MGYDLLEDLENGINKLVKRSKGFHIEIAYRERVRIPKWDPEEENQKKITEVKEFLSKMSSLPNEMLKVGLIP